MVTKCRIRVSVLDPDGSHFVPESRVDLSNEQGQLRMRRKTGRLWYEAWIDPGSYELSVAPTDTTELRAETRVIRVTDNANDVRVHLGGPDWPSYRIGADLIPFRPPVDRGRNLVAIVFDGRQPSTDLEERLKYELGETDQSGLESIQVRAGGTLWILRVDSTAVVIASVEKTLEAFASADNSGGGLSIRVGVPVNLTTSRLTVLTNRFLVQFRSPDNVDDFLKNADARIIRHNFIQNRRLKMIELDGFDFVAHQQTIAEWLTAGIIDYCEPELIEELATESFDPAVKPVDPEFDAQRNIIDQGVVEAWRYLHEIDSNLTLGNSDIYIATIDTGVNPAGFPQCMDAVSDGTPQLASCFDFRFMIPCSDPSYTVYDLHGMGVYGIISARTDNETDIAGIAPNCHHIGVRFKSTAAPEYFDMLLWAAGFQPFESPDDPPEGWPAPIAHPADIINCSHGPTSSSIVVGDTFKFLAENGRDTKGTVVVYSAGNRNEDITLTSSHKLAESEHTIAVTCTELRNCFEVKWDDPIYEKRGSNYGECIDICARGTGTRTIDQFGVPRTMGATSAAAAAVSATVGLMLSVCPRLSFENVREILRKTARKIDPYPSQPSGAWENGYSPWYGYGRLEIGAAVKAAHAACPTDEWDSPG